MATYGDEWILAASNAEVSVAPVFTSLQVGPTVKAILRQDRIQYLVVDRRLSTGLPSVGTYFDQPPATGEPGITKPIDLAALAKFDGVQNVSRVFDSGDIVIYDIEAITSGPSTAPTLKPSCTTAPSAAISSPYPKVAWLYAGTVYDLPTGLTTVMSLTGIQQRQGNLCGSFTGLNETGAFKGSIATDGHIQFIVMGQAGQALFTFDGLVQPDGILAGSYCHFVAGTCSSYGLWSLAPGK
jgi:hypothetical protein